MADLLERLKAALADRYTIARELGSGGMATVYLAQDLKHERQVAVKVLRPELAAALGPERFHQEIKIAAHLNHPHVLPLLDSGEADGFLYYVMPHVEGESLREKLAREGELPVAEAVRILRDVVDALSEAHEKGVVHRDIKPDNVLLTKHHALVTDFGVAKAVSEATGVHRLTTEGVALGTPAYMSPEQAAADKHIDHRADIYAVGALAYELLTGRPPFTGTTPQEVLSAQVTQAPEPVTKYRAAVPPALAHLVMKCLEKKAADRWQSAEELLPQLEALATPSGGITPTGTMPVGRARRRRQLVVGAALALAAVVIVVIGATLLLPRGRGGAPNPNRVLVVAFADQSGLEGTQALGQMAQDYIIQTLTEAGFAEVVDPLTALAVSQNVAEAGMAGGPGDVLALADEARAGTVVSGSYYAEGDSIHIQTRISDARDGSLMGAVGPIVGAVGAPRELVARLGRAVVAVIASLLNQELGPWEPTVQPAAHEAYEAYSQGVEAYLPERFIDAAHHFERAVTTDSTFSRARLWAAQSYHMAGWSYHMKAESLIAPLVESREQLSRYERCKLGFVIALGPRTTLSAAYDAAHCLAQAAPGSDDAKRELALFTMRSNHPGEAIELFRQLDPDRGLMKQWTGYWVFLGRVYHMVGDYEGELEVARRGLQRFPRSVGIHTTETYALAALGRLEDVVAKQEDVRSLLPQEGLSYWLGLVAAELRTNGHLDVAHELLDEAITWYPSQPQNTEGSRRVLAELLYQAERWNEALQLYEELAEEYPDKTTYLAALGRLAARHGDRAEALRISEELRDHSMSSVRWAQVPYHRARIAALLGDREEAMTLLRQAVDQMACPYMGYQPWLHRDIDFESLHDYPPFQELVRPKG